MTNIVFNTENHTFRRVNIPNRNWRVDYNSRPIIGHEYNILLYFTGSVFVHAQSEQEAISQFRKKWEHTPRNIDITSVTML